MDLVYIAGREMTRQGMQRFVQGSLGLLLVLAAQPLFAQGPTCGAPNVQRNVNPQFVGEGGPGETPLVSYDVLVAVDGDEECMTRITFQTADGTAASGSDYEGIPTTTIQACGGVDHAGTIAIVGDDELETDETFQFVVTSVESFCSTDCGCTIIPGTPATGGGIPPPDPVTVTIENDDFPNIVFENRQVQEGDEGLTQVE